MKNLQLLDNINDSEKANSNQNQIVNNGNEKVIVEDFESNEEQEKKEKLEEKQSNNKRLPKNGRRNSL